MSPLAASLQALFDPEMRDRLRWAVRVRWLVLLGFFTLALLADFGGLFSTFRPCLVAALLGAVMNGVNHWSVVRWRAVMPVTLVALSGDLGLITYVTVETGGVQSPFVIMYVVQVLATAMLVDTLVAAVVAVSAVGLFGGALVAEAVGLYEASGLDTPASSLLYRAAWSAFLLYALALLVYLGGHISGRLRASEHSLAERNRRLEAAVAALAGKNGELVRAYDRLKEAEAYLIHSEKMRALGQLVAGVAHELNNPISFVSANIEHLRVYLDRVLQLLRAYEGSALSDSDRERVERLERDIQLDDLLADLPGLLADCEEGAQRTKRIVSELRTFSRSDEHDRWRHVDLHRCIESTLALLGHRLKDRIAVHRDFGDLPEVVCLPSQINQVLMNLLANAADAIGGAGNIWIVTKRIDACSADSGQPSVELEIRDDGAGIGEEVRGRIFEPFFTTKDLGKGTGLGLSVSYGIVQRHGGSLTFESSTARGTAFVLRLPVERRQ
jgi:signal transduction histidine kinase